MALPLVAYFALVLQQLQFSVENLLHKEAKA